MVVITGLMRPALQGLVDPSGGPRRRRHLDWRSSRLVELQEPVSVMMDVVERRKVAPLASALDKGRPPEFCKKRGVALNELIQIAGDGRRRPAGVLDHLRIWDAERRRPRRRHPWSRKLRLGISWHSLGVMRGSRAPWRGMCEHPLSWKVHLGFGRQGCRPPFLLRARFSLLRRGFGRREAIVRGARTFLRSPLEFQLATFSARSCGATLGVLVGELFVKYIVEIWPPLGQRCHDCVGAWHGRAGHRPSRSRGFPCAGLSFCARSRPSLGRRRRGRGEGRVLRDRSSPLRGLRCRGASPVFAARRRLSCGRRCHGAGSALFSRLRGR